jgi:carboxyl-terminal processing protease
MKIKLKQKSKIIICVFLCALLLCHPFAGFAVFAGAPTETRIHPVLDELIGLFTEHSLYDITREQAIDSMLAKFLTDYPELLPYLGNSLLSADDVYGRYYSAGSGGGGSSLFHGYGIRLSGTPHANGHLYNTTISQVFWESPAEKAGLLAGDEIIKINGADVEGLGLNLVSHLLSYSDAINMTVRRGGEDITVSMRKATAYAMPLSYDIDEESKTAMIKILDFNDIQMLYDLFSILHYLDYFEFENIIIDLRDNPGGHVYIVFEVLNLFVPDEGAALFSVVYKDGETKVFESTGDGFAFNNLCVLVNERSASASEIFALSMSEIAGAAVIGGKTVGKGVGQEVFTLANRDTAAFTVFEVISPEGKRYHTVGVVPDIIISPVFAEVERTEFSPLNFVNIRTVKKGADNNAVLALNQRLAAIGYIPPGDITSELTEKTITAIGIFQRYNNLPEGITELDHLFAEILGMVVSASARVRYIERDVVLECAYVYIDQGLEAAKVFAEEFK